MEDGRCVAGIRIRTAKTETCEMEYFKFGQGRKVFVILPGLSVTSVTETAETVRRMYKQIANEFTVYVFDRRKDLPPVYSVRQMAEDTANVFRALGLEKVSIFGASQGGMMAMEIAIRHPELVEKLIVGSTSAKTSEETTSCMEEWIRLAKKKDARELYLAFGKALYPKKIFEQIGPVFAEFAEAVTQQDMERFIVLAEGIRDFDILDDLDKIRCPMLAIGDTDDRVTGAKAMEEIAERMAGHPDFELYMYEGYGHAVYDLAADYRSRILHFLIP